MKVSYRGWFLVGTFAAIVFTLVLIASPLLQAAAQPAQTNSGQLTEASLGQMLDAMGLEPKKEKQRYDFVSKALYDGEEWNLTMSTVLSQNGEWIWVMAWLDECPKAAADVPRTALLRLLAQNDRMGNGKFFAYIASNRRFVLQRVVKNEKMTTANFQKVLQDLGSSVIETYPYWQVSNWKSQSQQNTVNAMPSNEGKSAPKQPAATRRPQQTASQPSNNAKRQ